MKKNKIESLNGESLSKIKGGYGITHQQTSNQSTDHACGKHGCGASSGLLISKS